MPSPVKAEQTNETYTPPSSLRHRFRPSVRRMEGGRLTYYRQAADAAYWDEHWGALPSDIFTRARRYGTIPTLQALFTRYLPPDGLILEAGCGTGSMVAALQGMGFQAEGIDYAEQTIKAALAIEPDLPLKVGDVLAIDAPDGHYAGYVSLGVVEHRREGPEPFLSEAYRVLRVGGVACISTPYLHPLRALKGRLGLYRGQAEDLPFYQYAYPRDQLQAHLEAAGFTVLDWSPYDGFKGIKDELPFLQRVFKWRGVGWRLKRWLENAPSVEKRFGHMQMFICQKPHGE